MTTVDHAQRRRIIAEAVWSLLERGGPEAASVRAVVAETGFSSGSIRFFFSTQAELHEFAMTSLTERVRARVQRAADDADPLSRALAMISELMPLRDDTERELRVWLGFVSKAGRSQTMARVVTEQADAVRGLIESVLVDLVGAGLRPTGDLRAEVTALNAVVDGLTFELLTAPGLVSRDEARDVLEAFLLPDRAEGIDRD